TRRELVSLEVHGGQVRALAYSSDGSRILSGSDDATGRLCDARTGRLLQTLRGHAAPIYHCCFSADGSRALTPSRGSTAMVWDGGTGEPRATLSSARTINSAALSPEGRRVVMADESGDVRVADFSTGEDLLLPRDRVGFVSCADFGPDGTIITTSDTTRAC